MATTVTPSYYLSVGVLAIAVKSYVAAREGRFALTNLHEPCALKGHDARLTTTKHCSVCDDVVTDDSIVKGYKSGQGTYVFLKAEELAALKLDKDKTMTVVAFVPANQVDAVWLGSTNYIGPADGASLKAYQLLRQSMIVTKRAAVVRYVGYGREKYGLLRPTDDALMLHELFMADEVRAFNAQNRVELRRVELTEKETDLGIKLIDAYQADFDMSQFHDPYLAGVNALIEARKTGAAIPIREYREPKASDGADLERALMASLASAPSLKVVKGGAKAEARREVTTTTTKKSTAKKGARVA